MIKKEKKQEDDGIFLSMAIDVSNLVCNSLTRQTNKPYQDYSIREYSKRKTKSLSLLKLDLPSRLIVRQTNATRPCSATPVLRIEVRLL